MLTPPLRPKARQSYTQKVKKPNTFEFLFLLSLSPITSYLSVCVQSSWSRTFRFQHPAILFTYKNPNVNTQQTRCVRLARARSQHKLFPNCLNSWGGSSPTTLEPTVVAMTGRLPGSLYRVPHTLSGYYYYASTCWHHPRILNTSPEAPNTFFSFCLFSEAIRGTMVYVTKQALLGRFVWKNPKGDELFFAFFVLIITMQSYSATLQ